MLSTTRSKGNIEEAMEAEDNDDDYIAFLERFAEILGDCDDPGVLNIKTQLLAEVRMIADEVDEVVDLVRTTRQFEERFRAYSRQHVLLGQMANAVGSKLLRVTSAAALESAFRQQGLNEGEIAAAIELLTDDDFDPDLLRFVLTKRHSVHICKLSIFGVWVTWATPARPDDPYETATSNPDFLTLAAEVGLHPPPQANEDWLLLTYPNATNVEVLYPRIFDAAASAPPWNPYFTASTKDDGHGWARDTATGELIRPEGIHPPIDADVIADPAKRFEL